MHKECTMYVHNIVIWIQKFEYLSKFALLRRYRVIGYCYFMRGSRKSFGRGGGGGRCPSDNCIFQGEGEWVFIEYEFIIFNFVKGVRVGMGREGGGGSGPPAALLIVHVDYLREKLIGFGKYAYQKRRHSQALPT